MNAPLPRVVIDKDTLQRLGVVASQFGLTTAALRTEAKRGRLVISRVAGKDWTDRRRSAKDVRFMPVTPEVPTHGSGLHASAATLQSGSSETPDTSAALASAKAAVERLKRRSTTISSANTQRRARTRHSRHSNCRRDQHVNRR
jgi:hypothetical protein